MIKALYVALLETKIFLRDKASLAFSLLLPIAIFALMYGAFGGVGLFHGTAYVVNQDVNTQGQANTYSALIVDQLDALDNLDVNLLTMEDADRKLERSDILIAFYIPEDFSAKILDSQSVDLTIKQRGNGGNEGQIVASIVRSVVENINRHAQVHTKVAMTVGANYDQDVVNGYLNNPTVSVDTSAKGTPFNPVNRFLPGIVTMFILFGISMNARALYEERKRGTLERLITTQLSIGEMFTGKFLSYVARGFIQTLILFSLSYAVFRTDLFVTPAPFFEALLLCLVFSGVAGVFGLIIGSISRSEGQAIWMAVFFTMTMVMLGGTFFAISEGTVLYTISRFSVNTYINDAVKAVVIDHQPLTSVWQELLIMVGVIVLGLVASKYLFRVIDR